MREYKRSSPESENTWGFEVKKKKGKNNPNFFISQSHWCFFILVEDDQKWDNNQ